MDEYLKKRMFVYRRSYQYFNEIGILLSISKVVLNSLSTTGYYYFPLIFLSLGSTIIEILEKSFKINQRIEEYRQAFKFYNTLFDLYKAKTINNEDIYLRENEFLPSLTFFAREYYLQMVGLNGVEVIK